MEKVLENPEFQNLLRVRILLSCEGHHLPRPQAGKQGAPGAVGRMQNAEQCSYPTTPRAPSYNKEGRLGTRQGHHNILNLLGSITAPVTVD